MTSEQAYIEGKRAAMLEILRTAISNFDSNDPIVKRTRWRIERHEIVATLRDICAEDGRSNDWPDDLHLSDVIEKHVMLFAPWRSSPWRSMKTDPPPQGYYNKIILLRSRYSEDHQMRFVHVGSISTFEGFKQSNHDLGDPESWMEIPK